MRWQRALAIVAAVLVAGCATHPAHEVAPVERPVIANFEFEGRISASDGNRAASGTLRWVREDSMNEWTLLSPLGQIVAQVIGSPQGASLRTADGQYVESDSVDALLPRMLGVEAPADHLDAWLQARPAPGARVLATDAVGRPLRIADSSWIIEYASYPDEAPDAMPRRIDARFGDVRLRIVADHWTPLP